MDAEGRFEVCRLMKIVFEALPQGMAVGTNEIRLHLRFAYQAVPITEQNSLNVTSTLHGNSCPIPARCSII